MKASLFSALALTLALTLTGCGNPAEKSDNGACGVNVVGKYNLTGASCRNINTLSSAKMCKEAAEGFLRSYPDINCQAERQGQVVVISAREIQSLIDSLATTIATEEAFQAAQ